MELAWTKRITKQMRSDGALVVPYVGNMKQQNGFPDRIIISKRIGEIVLVEFKGAGTRIEPSQVAFHDGCNNQAPMSCWVAREGSEYETSLLEWKDEKGTWWSAEFNDTGIGLLEKINEMRSKWRTKNV